MKVVRNHVLKKLPVFALAAVMAIGGTSLSAFAEADPGSGVDTLLNDMMPCGRRVCLNMQAWMQKMRKL